MLLECTDMSLLWDFSTVADQLAQTLQTAEADLRLEQAVYGLDSRDELSIQTLLADGLTGVDAEGGTEAFERPLV